MPDFQETDINEIELKKKLRKIAKLEKRLIIGNQSDEVIIRTHEKLVELKNELHMDYTENIIFLAKQDTDDMCGNILFEIGYYYKNKGDIAAAKDYFMLFKQRTYDPDYYAEEIGYFADRWNEVKDIIADDLSDVSESDMSLYDKCDFGENMSALTDVEAKVVLCENFIEVVNADGFSEYFCTAFSRHCVETVKHLKSIGAKLYAKCLSEAIDLFPKDFDFSDETQTEDYIDRHEEHFDKFSEIESKIYDCEEDDIDDLLNNFAKITTYKGEKYDIHN